MCSIQVKNYCKINTHVTHRGAMMLNYLCVKYIFNLNIEHVTPHARDLPLLQFAVHLRLHIYLVWQSTLESGWEEIRMCYIALDLLILTQTYRIAENFWGRKLSQTLRFFGEHGIHWQHKWAIHKCFLHENRIFHQFAKVSSLESFMLQGYNFTS